MSEHFIKYINIERYKCFNDFSSEGLKRVNLISGKNNVGKTALLEAFRLNASAKSAPKLLKMLASNAFRRYQLEHIEDSTSEEALHETIKENVMSHAGSLAVKSNLNTVSFQYVDSAINRTYQVENNDQALTEFSISEVDLAQLLKHDLQNDKASVYIPSPGLSTSMLIRCFASVQRKGREQDIYQYLKNLDSAIENVKVFGGGSIQCKVNEGENAGVYRNLYEFGDGLSQYLTIILAIFYAEGRRLYIDDVGADIHYSSLDQLWEVILTLSKELNVQVFATTHSKECIESYSRVAQKLQDEDISFITLIKNKEKATKAIVRDYEMFTSSIHDEHEVRGC